MRALALLFAGGSFAVGAARLYLLWHRPTTTRGRRVRSVLNGLLVAIAAVLLVICVIALVGVLAELASNVT